MKQVLRILFAVAAFTGVSAARADITALSAHFAGGCASENSTGSCTIKVTAEGDSFGATDQVVVLTSSTRNGHFRAISKQARELDENGTARPRFKNIPGACFRVQTAENGDDASDVVSNTICEAAKVTVAKK